MSAQNRNNNKIRQETEQENENVDDWSTASNDAVRSTNYGNRVDISDGSDNNEVEQKIDQENENVDDWSMTDDA